MPDRTAALPLGPVARDGLRVRGAMAAMTTLTRPGTVPADRLRQVTVTVAELFCVVGTLVGRRGDRHPRGGVGRGRPRGRRDPHRPGRAGLCIWTPIYLGLAGFTVFQWLPTQTAEPRHRAIGWLAAASMVLNAAWLLVTQQDWIWVSVVVMAALVATLALLVRRLEEHPSYGHGETVLVDGTFGLYLGWVAVAACANVTAALVASGVDPGGLLAQLAAVVVLAVAAGVGVLLARRLGGRWAVAVAMAWGLLWIAWGRLAAEPRSVVVALAAVVAAVVVLVATSRMHSVPARRLRPYRRPRRSRRSRAAAAATTGCRRGR